MVAKSYANLEQIGEPYVVNGRMYVKIRTKNNVEKQVRWYNEIEYARMYGGVAPEEEKKNDFPNMKTQHDVLGFEKGYITIFKGNTYANLNWFHQSSARYCRWWGWYIVSTEKLPENIPYGLEPIQLNWDAVGNADGSLKPETEITPVVESLIYDEGTSEYVGEIGERLELTLTVERAIQLDNSYGSSTMHIMNDKCGNTFVWTTASKYWPDGTTHHIRGTVKDHRVYRNNKQTILNRCTEVKE